MTTVIFKDGLIAWDSRATSGSMIINDEADEKVIFKTDSVAFGFSGLVAQYQQMSVWLLKNYTGPASLMSMKKFDGVNAIIIDGDQKRFVRYTGNGLVSWKLTPNTIQAVGSGSDFALGAAYAGATAPDAVKIAAQLDSGSGGSVNSRRVLIKE